MININHPRTNENENVAASLATPRANLTTLFDWRLVLIVIGFAVFLWTCAIGYTGFQCASDYAYDCPAQDLAFWSLPALVTVGGISYGAIVARGMWHRAQREQYLNVLSEHISYRDIARHYAQTLDVSKTVAQSLASADMDTYSPSVTGGKAQEHTPQGAKPDTKDISIASIFGGKD